MSATFTYPETASLAKAAASRSSDSTTRGTPKTPSTPWTDGCSTAGSCGCRWPGTVARRRHTAGTAADEGHVPDRVLARGTRVHVPDRAAGGAGHGPGTTARAAARGPGLTARVRGVGPGRLPSPKGRGPNLNPTANRVLDLGLRCRAVAE
jgi:hypothetical protein